MVTYPTNCPYCGATSADYISNRRPDQKVLQCTGCSKYFVQHINKSTYVLDNPLDSNGTPQVNG